MPQTTAYRPTPPHPTTAPAPRRAETTVEATDELLDEIDAVLEENANEVIIRYVQRGGQ